MAKNDENYAYLDRLSTKDLKEILRADMESPESGNEDVIFYILGVIEQRETEDPTWDIPSKDDAWDEFNAYYNIPEGDGLSLYPSEHEDAASDVQRPERPVIRIRRLLKHAIAVAAVVAVLFAGMVAAQASGVDVFGVIARWTDENFRFITPAGEEAQDDPSTAANIAAAEEEPYRTLAAAFEENGFPVELVPRWYPAGYNVSEPSFMSGELCDLMNTQFFEKDDQFFSIVIIRYHSSEALNSFTFEKDNAEVEAYSNGKQTFYILSNLNSVTATWSDGYLVETISGALSVDELKLMIDSIGG